MTAVPALPYLHFALLKYLRSLNILQQGAISLLVMFLNGAYHTEFGCQFRESFCFCSLGKLLVHIRPLVILSICGCIQICHGISQTLQFLKPHLCMLFFVIRSFQE